MDHCPFQSTFQIVKLAIKIHIITPTHWFNNLDGQKVYLLSASIVLKALEMKTPYKKECFGGLNDDQSFEE
jgi:hypothetical protein